MLQLSHVCKKDGRVEPFVLMHEGPWVVVEIRVPPEMSQRLAAERKPIPQPVRGRALIDTGATATFMDLSVSKTLGLQPLRQDRMGSPGSTEHFDANVYDVGVAFFEGGNVVHVAGPVEVAECAISNQQLIMLLGRDFLSGVVFTYNGPGASFTVVAAQGAPPKE